MLGSSGFIVLLECHWNVNRPSYCQIKVNVRRGEGGLRGRWDREGVTSRVHSKQNKSYFSRCKSIISWGGNIRIFERLYIKCAFSLGRFFTLYLDEAPLLRRR